MNPTPDKLRVLELLVEELLKDDPKEDLVQKCFTDAGLPDNKDPIDRINKVLMALHFEEQGKEFEE